MGGQLSYNQFSNFIVKQKLYICTAIHFLISCIFERSIFYSIKDYTGSENVAYKWLITGGTLSEDLVSKVLCWSYSHLLAIVLIFYFWKFVFKFISVFNYNKKQYTEFLVAGLLIMVAVAIYFPTSIFSAPDESYNYVYAKEWLPMYWHGFFTNVVHCACMIFFPHPISMSLIPCFIGLSLLYKIVKDLILLGGAARKQLYFY